jgi:broad specificity phosphatase PhoE
MRLLEVRRHTIRSLSSPHISQDGVDLARRVGEGLGQFDRVITSTLPRAFETAIAMGYAVDEQIEQLCIMSEEVGAIVQWNAGYAAWAKAAANNPAVGLYTQALAELWRSIVRALPEGGRALIINHGGIVEAGTVGCLPPAANTSYGPACRYCEGARLTFDGDLVAHVEILRVQL